MTIRPNWSHEIVYSGMLILCLYATMFLQPEGLAQDTTNESSGTSVISGVLKEFNEEENRGMLVTDSGEPLFLDIPEPRLFSTIRIGQQIIIQVDSQGKVTKAIETPIPELKQPLP